MRIVDRPSPNFGERRDAAPVDMLVLHYTDLPDAGTSLARLCDPDAEVSAHYLIDEDGTVFRLVAETMRAWHAGVSFWRGHADVNSRSIGVELQNPGHSGGYRRFPEAQMESLVALAREIQTRWPVEPRNVVGHSDVAPGRKRDPGELFDWRRLAAEGIGLWPEPEAADATAVPDMLRRIGYDTSGGHAVAAFQRHYRPQRIDGVADAGTAALCAGLLRLIEAGST